MSKQAKNSWILALVALLLAQLACSMLEVIDCESRGGTLQIERDDDGRAFSWCQIPEPAVSAGEAALQAENQPPVCREKNLSAEECAALGVHRFEIITCGATGFNETTCRCGDTIGAVEFSGDELMIQLDGRSQMFYTKRGPNLYQNVHTWGDDNVSTSTMSFTADGFTIKTETRSQLSDALVCIFDKKALFTD
jgi:putative hemolysin